MVNSTKVADDIFMVPWDQGNGVIRREAWLSSDGAVRRYQLAYLNQDICAGDNGRVLGLEYDGGELREYRMGTHASRAFDSLEELERHFDRSWNELPRPSDPPTGRGAGQTLPPDDQGEYAETRRMKLSITKGAAADFFRRGRELAAMLDRGERPEPHKVIMYGSRMDLCYTQKPKTEWASLRERLAAGETTAFE